MAREGNAGNTLTGAPEISREELQSRLRTPSLTIVDVLPAESYAANLSSALTVLSELLVCLPGGFVRSEPLEIGLKNELRLAEDICGDCVPPTPTLRGSSSG